MVENDKATEVDVQSFLRTITDQDDQLYERYGKHLETGHSGEYLAINRKDGSVIVSTDDIYVIDQALEKFGAGNFAFRKIGSSTLGKWRTRLAR